MKTNIAKQIFDILHHIVQVQPSQKPERSGRVLPVGVFDVEVYCHSLKRWLQK